MSGLLVRVAVIVTVAGCQGCSVDPPDVWPDASSDVVSDTEVGSTADVVADDAEPTSDVVTTPPVAQRAYPLVWEIVYGAEAPSSVAAVAADVREILEDRWGFAVTIVNDAAAADIEDCLSNTGRVIFAGDGVSQPSFATVEVTSRTWSVREHRCSNGTAVTLSGGGALGRQVAAYRMLEGWGVRFFHPLDIFAPDEPWWPASPLSLDSSEHQRWRLGGTADDDTVRWQLANGATAFFGDAASIATRELPRALIFDAMGSGDLVAALNATSYAIVVLDLSDADGETTSDIQAAVTAAADTIRTTSPEAVVAARVAVEARTADGAWLFQSLSAVPVSVAVQLMFGEGTRFRGAGGAAVRAFFEDQAPYRRFHYGFVAGGPASLDAPLGLVGEVGVRLDDLHVWQQWANKAPGGWDGVQVQGLTLEWWRWAVQVALLRAGADTGLNVGSHFEHLGAPMAGPARAVVAQVLSEAAQLAIQELHTDGGYGLLAAPIPVLPTDVPLWSLGEVFDWNTTTGPLLDRVTDAHADWLTRLAAVANAVEPAGKPWFGELYDSVEASALWAAHVRRCVDAVALKREGYLRFDDSYEALSATVVELLPQTTMSALALMQRRESDYRDGIEPLLQRAHTTAAYLELEAAVAAGLTSLGGLITVDDVLLGPTETLHAEVTAEGASAFEMAYGDDGATDLGTVFDHTYAEVGFYPLSATGTVDGAPAAFGTHVVQTSEEHVTGLTGHVLAPAGVDLIDVAFPSVTLGKVADGEWVIGYSREADGQVGPDRWSLLSCVETVEAVTCSMPTLVVPAVNAFSGEGWLGSLEMLNVVVEATWATGQVTLAGEVIIGSIVVLAQGIFGFEEQAAIDTIAGLLGVDPATMPPQMPFLAEYQLPVAPPAP